MRTRRKLIPIEEAITYCESYPIGGFHCSPVVHFLNKEQCKKHGLYGETDSLIEPWENTKYSIVNILRELKDDVKSGYHGIQNGKLMCSVHSIMEIKFYLFCLGDKELLSLFGENYAYDYDCKELDKIDNKYFGGKLQLKHW